MWQECSEGGGMLMAGLFQNYVSLSDKEFIALFALES